MAPSNMVIIEYMPLKLVIVLTVSALLIIGLNDINRDQYVKEYFLPPPQKIEDFTLGYQELVADLFWLRVVQDFDFCRNKDIPKAANTGHGLDKVLQANMTQSRCQLGWVYQMMQVVTDLAPRFLRAYRASVLMLSIGVDDREGARRMIEKGLKRFPDDYHLNYYGAYHYLYEIQDPKRAAELMLAASRSEKAPSWLPALAARLYTKAGQAHFGIAILEDFIAREKTGEAVERAKKRLKEIKKSLK
jgi:hypothetical protein